MPTYRLDVEYMGTRYAGWQEQKNARTVAGELRRCCEEAAGERLALGGSGRTDRGVHALRQVAHLRSRRALDPAQLREGVNDRLPPDINLLAVAPATDRFHARHDAAARSYLYQVSRRRTAFGKPLVWWVQRPLDARAMAAALPAFLGRHDFAGYCEAPAKQESTQVQVERAELAEAGDLILIRLVASHFLWRMVRRVAGVLVGIGVGEVEASEAIALLADPRARVALKPAERTAPPSGLFLEQVIYGGEEPLGSPRPVLEIGAERASRSESRRHMRRPG